MAVEINHNGKNNKLDLLYYLVKDEELKMSTPTQYHFAQKTNSVIQFLEKSYIPKNIYITPKLHLATTINSECELVLECIHEEMHKIFLCIGLVFSKDSKNDEWVFPLKSPYLDKIFSQCSKNYIYETKSKNYVIVCSSAIVVNGVKPPLDMSAKTLYKDIIDGDSYDVLSLISSSSDNDAKKVQSQTSNVSFKQMLFYPNSEKTEDVKEGFNDGTYMECELLREDEADIDQVYEDVAVVPLDTNTYERGMVTFSHFLHFFLVTFGAGIGLPHLFLMLFSKGDFLSNGMPNTFLTIIGYSSFLLFFVSGLIMLLVGLLNPKYKKMKKNDKEIKQGSVLATLGFYFILIHCSFALGMFTMKKFEYSEFKNMFRKDELSGSFFSIMDGFKLS